MTVRDQRARRLRGQDQIFYAGDQILAIPLLRGGAGSYPDAPARRMAYDADGTVVVGRQSNNVLFEPSQAVLDLWNAEDPTGAQTGEAGKGMIWIFPELREFDGIVQGRRRAGLANVVESSGDTTNGLDGTFTQRHAGITDNLQLWRPEYRTTITSLAVSNVRGAWLNTNYDGISTQNKRLEHCHIYGEISAGETPDRLLWFDNDTSLEFAKPQDYGDVPRGSAEDHVTFLKNNSVTLTANTVQVTAEDLYLAMAAWLTFDDGTGFSATKALAAAIGPAANSPNITIRRIIPDAEVLGLHAARAFVSVGSWT